MSTVLYADATLAIVEYWGGNARGRCLQVTTPDGQYVQLDRAQLAILARLVELRRLVEPDVLTR
jgi:hypothetical protein